ncbi:ATP-binding protein [Candidatus Halobeggiatoa sp. HSG11]|nr:ATP-binding protein [Candidatus Halobeggiatoa sp. HSG11]
MNIKTKILLIVGITVVISVGVMTYIISNNVAKHTQAFTYQIADETAHRYGFEVKAELEKAMEEARMLELAFWQLKLAGNVDRRILDQILIKTILHDPKLLGSWMLWETNAYDGRDKEFVNTEGHGPTGRVNSYWHWDKDKIVVEPNIDWDTSEWYQIPQQRKKETLTDPYVYKVSGKDMLLISTIQPIMQEEKFHGVAGIDYKLDALQDKVKQLKVLENGYSALFANNGMYVAHHSSTLVGQTLGESAEDKALMEAIKSGKRYETIITKDKSLGEEVYRLSIPIIIGETDTPWAFVVNIPTRTITELAVETRNSVILIGGILGLLMIIVLMIMMNRLINPITIMSRRLEKTVSHQTDRIEELPVESRDEVGILAKSFNTMARHLNSSREKLEDVNQEIRVLNEELEQRVEERTEELSQANQELVQSEKMASLGRLVAGFAHELNTPIGVAVGTASTLQNKTKFINQLLEQEEVDEEELLAALETVDEASELTLSNLRRASNLVNSFKRTAVDQTSEEVRRFDVKLTLEDVVNTLHNKFKRTDIKIQLNCSDKLNIYSIPGALEQILTNLIMNSWIHGFDEGKNGGNIVIAIQLVEQRLKIEYSDTGKGIAPEVLEQVFEPFFTTNRVGGGSGLGMYICYNIVTTQLEGSMMCESVVGEGVVFKIEFPVTV